MFICPVCQKELVKEGHEYKCPNGHSYDLAKEGYVNLLLANQKRTFSGDPKDSLLGRQRFLNQGYYQNLSEKLNELVKELNSKVILDAGVGTGYYLSNLINYLDNADNTYYGIDVGKEEVKMAAKKIKNANLAVANIFHLPFPDQSLDLILSIFSPYAPEEFKRTLGSGGKVLAVQPGKEHLYELKKAVYAEPYYNPDKGYNLEGFQTLKTFHLENTINLPDQQTIEDLWTMTPYAHKTSKEDSEKLLNLNELTVTTDFYISLYQKEEV